MNNDTQTPVMPDDIDLRLEETLANTREGRVEFATFSSGEYVHSILIESGPRFADLSRPR